MGATYTRQSTYADGDTITAAHTNDEFDQLLAAFAASTGHTHDGTTGEGGPISTLAGHALTFGAGTAGTDIVITFDGETNDGVLKWMEDEDYFEFSDDILMATTEKLQFRDTAIYINSSADGQLDLVADTEIQIAATTIDINGLVDISGNLSVGGNLDVTGTFDLSDANFTNAGDIQLDSISGDSDTNTSITFSGSDVITVTTGGETQITFNNGSILPTTDNDIDLGSSSFEFKDIYIDGTAYLDAINFNGTAISSTAAELNILSGKAFLNESDLASNSATGIPSQQSVKAYVDNNASEITASSTTTFTNKTLTAPKIVDGGFIADANGNELVVFQTTSSAVNQLEITNSASSGNPIIAATGGDTNIGIALTPKGTGEIVISAGNLNYGGTAVTATGAELNLLDGNVVTPTTLTLADDDGIVVLDLSATTTKNIRADNLATYFTSKADVAGSTTTFTNKTFDQDATGNSITNLANASIKSGAAIDATKIANGTVTSTEFQYIGGLTSDVQTQLDTKATTGKAIAMAMVFG